MARRAVCGGYPVLGTHCLDYYDGPISGWLRAAGRYWLFHRERRIDPETDEEVWPEPLMFDLYDIPREQRLAALKHFRRWLLRVHRPWRRALTQDSRAIAPHEDWMAFYNDPDEQGFRARDLTQGLAPVGSTDLTLARFRTILT